MAKTKQKEWYEEDTSPMDEMYYARDLRERVELYDELIMEYSDGNETEF